MKQTYAVYCRINLTPEPKWLLSFRAKYDKPYDFHLTLKQTAYIDEDQLTTIKQRVAKIVAAYASLEKLPTLHFDKLVLDEYDDYDHLGWIYLFSNQRSSVVDELQYSIRTALTEFSDYVNPASDEYEHDFKPHITIGRELNSRRYGLAVKELPPDLVCDGEISEVVVTYNVEEDGNEINRLVNNTVYEFPIHQ